jgi:hypothetical protein
VFALLCCEITGALTAGALAPNLETEHVGGAGLGTRLALGIVITSAGDRASWFACTWREPSLDSPHAES